MMEAMACRDGMILARENAVVKLQIETDNQESVGLWQQGDYHHSYLAPILREIALLSAGFADFSLMYASRSCNRIAHVLAQQVTEDRKL